MPIVTQNRVADHKFPYSYRYSNGGAVIPQTFYGGKYTVGTDADHTQTTTSFRGSEEADYEQMSGVDIIKNLRTEYYRSYDNGHEFSSVRRFQEHAHTSRTLRGGRQGYSGSPFEDYTGPIWTDLFTSSRPGTNAATQGVLDAYGRKFIGQTAPTSPEAGLATFLGELREGLPRIIGHSAIARHQTMPQKGSSEYLNWQFGLKPFANDLTKMALAVSEFHRKVNLFRQSSDLIVHKKAHLNETSSSRLVSNDSGVLNLAIAPNNNEGEVFFFNTSAQPPPVVTLYETILQRTWFSGAFSYHLAEAHSFLGKMERYDQLANQLLGTRITPEVVWELTPWSWLVDWVFDAGQFFKNLTLLSSDSLVLRFGYVMCETHTTWTKSIGPLQPRTGVTGCPSTVASSWKVISKQRRRASPYGFGLNPATFSGRQWAILGALGMTKSPVSLRSGL